MGKKVLFLSLALLSSSALCNAEKLGDTPSLLVMQGGIGMQIDVENVEEGVPFNTFVGWIGNIDGAHDFFGSLSLALIAQDGEIKELIHEEEDVYLSPGWGFGQWAQFCSLTVNTEIAPTDIIRFITRENGADQWLPVMSSECPITYCKAKGNELNIAKVTVNILGKNDIPVEKYCIDTLFGDAKQYNAIYSSSYYIDIHWPEGKDHHFVKVSPNSDRIQIGTDDILIQRVEEPSYEISLMACSDEDLVTEPLHISVESPGSLRQQLKDNENLLYINNITVSGTLSEDDIQFMRDDMPMLEYIDLSDARIAGDILPNMAFENKGIKSIVLPQSLKGLGFNSLKGTKLYKLDIPKGVNFYDLNALNYSENLTLLVLHNPKVISIDWCVLNGTNRSKGALFVPKGTKDAFAADVEWGKFGMIVEGENTDDWVSDSDGTYSYSGIYPDVVLTQVDTPTENMIVPETIELNGRQYNVTGIGERTFKSPLIQKIHLPKSVIKLGKYAISSTSLEEVEVAEDNPVYFSNEGVLYDGSDKTLIVYPSAKPANEYEVPKGIVSIDGWACSNDFIEKITFPSTLENIGQCAFCYSGLAYCEHPVIISKAKVPPYISAGAFDSQTYINADVYVPSKSLEAYKNNGSWGNFYKLLPLDDDSGIAEIKTDESLISVDGNVLTVESGYPVEIYSIDGKLLYNSSFDTFVLPTGIYILRINGVVRKIRI